MREVPKSRRPDLLAFLVVTFVRPFFCWKALITVLSSTANISCPGSYDELEKLGGIFHQQLQARLRESRMSADGGEEHKTGEK